MQRPTRCQPKWKLFFDLQVGSDDCFRNSKTLGTGTSKSRTPYLSADLWRCKNPILKRDVPSRATLNRFEQRRLDVLSALYPSTSQLAPPLLAVAIFPQHQKNTRVINHEPSNVDNTETDIFPDLRSKSGNLVLSLAIATKFSEPASSQLWQFCELASPVSEDKGSTINYQRKT